MDAPTPTDIAEETRPTTVLIVEDDPALRDLLSVTLHKVGYQVLAAATGQEGLQLVRQHLPELVLLDVVIGDPNGLGVCRQIKADPALHGVFILLMSGLATDVKSEVGGRECGADDYLLKPFEIPLLLARLRTMERLQKAETALRESEANYRSLFDNLVAGVARVTPAGRILMANPALARMLGYDSPEELIATVVDVGRQLYVEPQRRPRVIAQLEQEGFLKGFEIQVQRKNGEVIWLVTHARVRRDVRGRVLYYESVLDDITERKRTEVLVAALSSLGQRLNSATTLQAAARIIVEVADELFGWDACLIDLLQPGTRTLLPVFAADLIQGCRTEVPSTSPEFSPLARQVIEQGARLILRSKAPAGELELKPFGDVSRSSASLLFVPIRNGEKVIGILSIQSYACNAYSPDDLAILEALADYCGGAFERLRAGEELAELNRSLEQRVAERTVAWSEANRALCQEITERELAEDSLRDSEERHRSLVAALQEGVLLQDADGVIRMCNASARRILGLDDNAILGRAPLNPCWQAIHEDGTPFPDEAHPALAVLASGQPQSNVVMGARKPDGSLTWISINAEPILQPGESRPQAVVCTFTDITERKRAMEALQTCAQRVWEAQEAERQRVARELHDGVSQLIASVRFRLRGLEARLSATGQDDLRRDAGQAQAHLEKAMDEVRRVARNLRPGELDDLGFQAAINCACNEFTVRTKIPVELESFSLPRRLPPEMELALYRIVQEALTNIERHAQATRVTLRLTQIGRQLALTISDNGKGLAASQTLTDRAGLGIVNIIERAAHLGGKAKINSQPGAGTEINVRIPVKRENKGVRHGIPNR